MASLLSHFGDDGSGDQDGSSGGKVGQSPSSKDEVPTKDLSFGLMNEKEKERAQKANFMKIRFVCRREGRDQPN